MNPWLVVLVVLLVLFTSAWMVDRGRRRRDGVFAPGDVSTALRRSQGHDAASGASGDGSR